jgi:hypothetical protein
MPTEEEETKAEIVSALERRSRSDYVAVATRIGVSSIPFIGGALTELVTQFIPESKKRRIAEFVAQLSIDVGRIHTRINSEVIRTEEFAYIFEQTFRAVNENYERAKLDAFRGILLNSIIRTDVQTARKELYLRLTRDLLPIHIEFLKVFKDPNAYIRANSIQMPQNISATGFIEMIRPLFPQFSNSEVRIVIRDLYNAGLTNITPDSLGTMVTWNLGNLQNRLTELGRSLVDFITVPS